MKLSIIGVLGISTLIWSPSLAISPPRQTAPHWTELFNAQDLSGWHQRGGGKAFVRNGILILEHDTERRPGYLIADIAPLKDFQAILICRIPTGDSGFFYRGELHPRHATEFQGPQLQLNMQSGCGLGGIFELHGRCWVSKPDAALEEKVRCSTAPLPPLGTRESGSVPPGEQVNGSAPTAKGERESEWLTCELTVKGSHIRARINGITTVDITDAGADNHFQEAGRFALQIHGGGYCRAEFRRIAVRRLD